MKKGGGYLWGFIAIDETLDHFLSLYQTMLIN